MLVILEQAMLIDSDEYLVFETGFWWFARTRYKKVGDHKNLADIVGQYTWFLEKELDIEARLYLENGWFSNRILIRASEESLAMLKLMIQ